MYCTPIFLSKAVHRCVLYANVFFCLYSECYYKEKHGIITKKTTIFYTIIITIVVIIKSLLPFMHTSVVHTFKSAMIVACNQMIMHAIHATAIKDRVTL